ncbi:unknown protein [Seminavis robusta]|uniref:Uncharacterized protein n=1 Tax=Seminavis robusta TaxID=568900 RepID=A0A9N8HHL5_9STRA|nr:unknown protein [Seminavis robusta]|eukprot:Sro645_g180600.1 n/a (256) ;mRNA; r:14675-15706
MDDEHDEVGTFRATNQSAMEAGTRTLEEEEDLAEATPVPHTTEIPTAMRVEGFNNDPPPRHHSKRQEFGWCLFLVLLSAAMVAILLVSVIVDQNTAGQEHPQETFQHPENNNTAGSHDSTIISNNTWDHVLSIFWIYTSAATTTSGKPSPHSPPPPGATRKVNITSTPWLSYEHFACTWFSTARFMKEQVCKNSSSRSHDDESIQTVETLHIMQNNLQGSLPDELGLLTNLKKLWLGRNNLQGTIIPQIGIKTWG